MSPSRPLRPCSQPGCPALVRSGRCPDHQAKRKEHDPEQRRFYNSGWWQALRALVRQQQPICAECKERKSETVDHINGDHTDNRRENLAALCWRCHRAKSGREHRGKRET